MQHVECFTYRETQGKQDVRAELRCFILGTVKLLHNEPEERRYACSKDVSEHVVEANVEED